MHVQMSVNNQTGNHGGNASIALPDASTIVSFYIDSLNISVTDNNKDIEAAAKRKDSVWLRLRQSASGEDRAEGKRLFNLRTHLRDRLSEVLDVVYHSFKVSADTAVAGFVAAGINKVTPDLCKDIRNQALHVCRDRADDALIEKWVSRYILEKGWIFDDPIITIEPPKNVRCRRDINKITIQWDLPKNCDEIIITRKGGEKTKSEISSKKGLVLGKSRLYVDSEVKSEKKYAYQVYARFKGFESDPSPPISIIAVGDLGWIKAEIEDNAVKLSGWRHSVKMKKLLIFRSDTGPVSIRVDRDGPQPVDQSTKLLASTTDEIWRDHNIDEGNTYHYAAVADYGDHLYTQPVEVAIEVPKPPDSPRQAVTEYVNGVVLITVTPESRSKKIKYIVVRREGSLPASRPAQGKEIMDVKNVQNKKGRVDCEDETVVPGRCYTYSVFAELNGIRSHTGAHSEPVFTLAEVDGLSASTGDKVVSLKWSQNKNVARVEVHRRVGTDVIESTMNPQERMNEFLGEKSCVDVNVVGNSAHDRGLDNGCTYEYMVRCVYHVPPNGDEKRSVGRFIICIPNKDPAPPDRFECVPRGDSVVCNWLPVSFGEVRVYRLNEPHGYKYGEFLNHAEDLKEFGDPLNETHQNYIEDNKPDSKTPYYAVFNVAGSRAVAGKVVECLVARDIDNLKAEVLNNGDVKLEWDWPAECTSVAILRREGVPPMGIDDGSAEKVRLAKFTYENAGNMFPDRNKNDLKPGLSYHYAVYAQVKVAKETRFSKGLGRGCNASIRYPQFINLEYKISIIKKLFGKKRKIKVVWNIDCLPISISGFVVIGNTSHCPNTFGDGIEILRWSSVADGTCNQGEYESVIPETVASGRYLCRLFPLKVSEDQRIISSNPDSNRPLELG